MEGWLLSQPRLHFDMDKGPCQIWGLISNRNHCHSRRIRRIRHRIRRIRRSHSHCVRRIHYRHRSSSTGEG